VADQRRDELRLTRLYAATFLALACRDLEQTDHFQAILAGIERQIDELEHLKVPTPARGAAPWSFRLAIDFARRELPPPATNSR
jgi:hypothetical protein